MVAVTRADGGRGPRRGGKGGPPARPARGRRHAVRLRKPRPLPAEPRHAAGPPPEPSGRGHAAGAPGARPRGPADSSRKSWSPSWRTSRKRARNPPSRARRSRAPPSTSPRRPALRRRHGSVDGDDRPARRGAGRRGERHRRPPRCAPRSRPRTCRVPSRSTSRRRPTGCTPAISTRPWRFPRRRGGHRAASHRCPAQRAARGAHSRAPRRGGRPWWRHGTRSPARASPSPHLIGLVLIVGHRVELRALLRPRRPPPWRPGPAHAGLAGHRQPHDRRGLRHPLALRDPRPARDRHHGRAWHVPVPRLCRGTGREGPPAGLRHNGRRDARPCAP